MSELTIERLAGLRLTPEKREQLRRLTEAVEHGTAPVITHEADLAARAFREIERLRAELEAKKEMTVGVIPIREAQKAVWELWEVVWQVLKDSDGSHTTHFASVSLIKERAIEIRDKLARGEQV